MLHIAEPAFVRGRVVLLAMLSRVLLAVWRSLSRRRTRKPFSCITDSDTHFAYSNMSERGIEWRGRI